MTRSQRQQADFTNTHQVVKPMIPNSFPHYSGQQIPASVALSCNLVSLAAMPGVVINDQTLKAIANANALLELYLKTETLAELVINNLMQGVATSVEETALQLPNMLTGELEMEIDRLQLLADLMSAAKRAVGRCSNDLPFSQQWNDDNDQAESGGEYQAVPGI